MNVDYVNEAFKKTVDGLREFPYRGYKLTAVRVMASPYDTGKGKGVLQAFMPNSPLHPKDMMGVLTGEIEFDTDPRMIASIAFNACLSLKLLIDNAYEHPELVPALVGKSQAADKADN